MGTRRHCVGSFVPVETGCLQGKTPSHFTAELRRIEEEERSCQWGWCCGWSLLERAKSLTAGGNWTKVFKEIVEVQLVGKLLLWKRVSLVEKLWNNESLLKDS